MKDYICGPFKYTLPETACVFCCHADILWDFSNGIYCIICDKDTSMPSKCKGNILGDCCNFKEE